MDILYHTKYPSNNCNIFATVTASDSFFYSLMLYSLPGTYLQGHGSNAPNDKLCLLSPPKESLTLRITLENYAFAPPKCVNNQVVPKEFLLYLLVVHLSQWTHLFVQVVEGNLILLPQETTPNWGLFWFALANMSTSVMILANMDFLNSRH